MKIYQFYLYKKVIRHKKYPAISEDKIYETSSGKYSCLYGYTDSKIIRDEFIEYRNMDIFKMKTVSMTKEEYERFSELNPDELLEYNSFGTAGDVNDTTKVLPVALVVTNKESSMVFFDYDMVAEGSLNGIFNDINDVIKDSSMFYDNIINFPNIFKHDISEALNYMEFIHVMFDYFSPESLELPFKIFTEDKLMVYIKLFGNTYKKDML